MQFDYYILRYIYGCCKTKLLLPLMTNLFVKLSILFLWNKRFWFLQVKLERVLGLTVSSNAALACDSNSGTIAYPAG